MMTSQSDSKMCDVCDKPEVLIRFRSRAGLIIKIVWTLLAFSFLALFAYSIIIHFVYQARAVPFGHQGVLEQLGLSLELYALYDTGLDVIVAVVFFVVAGGIFWRISGDWVARLVSLSLLTVGMAMSPSRKWKK